MKSPLPLARVAADYQEAIVRRLEKAEARSPERAIRLPFPSTDLEGQSFRQLLRHRVMARTDDYRYYLTPIGRDGLEHGFVGTRTILVLLLSGILLGAAIAITAYRPGNGW